MDERDPRREFNNIPDTVEGISKDGLKITRLLLGAINEARTDLVKTKSDLWADNAILQGIHRLLTSHLVYFIERAAGGEMTRKELGAADEDVQRSICKVISDLMGRHTKDSSVITFEKKLNPEDSDDDP